MKTIRLNSDNLDSATQLVKTFKNSEVSPESVEAFLKNDSNFLIGTFENDKPIGILIAYLLDRPDGNRPMMYIHDIEVLESHRQKGAATSMLNMIKDIAREKNCLKTFLITNKNNQAAVNLYKKASGDTPHDDDLVFIFNR